MTTLRISRKKGPFADDPQVVGETVKHDIAYWEILDPLQESVQQTPAEELDTWKYGETIIIYTTLETLFHLFEGVTVR